MSLNTVDGKLYCFGGKSRSGKTASAVQLVKRIGVGCPVFVWDIEAQWCEIKGYTKVTSLNEFKRLLKNGTRKNIAFVDVSDDIVKTFELFCMCCWHYAQHIGPFVLVSEELADVEKSGKASPFWGRLLRRGLKRGVSIVAISQRWQEADKTALGNASFVYCFQQANVANDKYMAQAIGCPVEMISNLKIVEKKSYEYIEFDSGSKIFSKKVLKFS